MDLIYLELTSGEIHDNLRAIYSQKEHYKQELREFENCNQEISDQQSIDIIKCKIDDLECLEKKLLKARNEWLVRPLRSVQANE